MRRALWVSVCCAMLTAALPAVGSAKPRDKDTHVQLLAINDLHGHLQPNTPGTIQVGCCNPVITGGVQTGWTQKTVPAAGIEAQLGVDLDDVGLEVGRRAGRRGRREQALAVEEPERQLLVVAGRAHGHRERLAAHADLERLLDRHPVEDAVVLEREREAQRIDRHREEGYPRTRHVRRSRPQP